jgi:hypothetical protein
MKLLCSLLMSCFVFTASAQQSALPFSLTAAERTEGLPTYVSPPAPNLYNSNPGLKVGWGIDSPTGHVVIDGEVWVMFNSGNQYGTHVNVARFKGTDFEHTTRQADGAIDVDKDVSTHFCGGLWYDSSTGTLYAPIHCEYKHDMNPPGGWCRKKVRLATSTDKGVTWKLEGDILTDQFSEGDDWLKYSGSYFEAGPGDFDFFADTIGGYFYIYSCNAYAPKNGSMNNYLWFNEVARCAFADKMAPGTWRKFCNGTWTEPGLGGHASKVMMDSYGIYGRIMYNSFLKKYLRIGVTLGVIDRRFTNLGFKDGSIYISTCHDLAKQEWSPRAKVFNSPDNDKFGITLADGSGRDPFVCGASLRIYNYWLYNMPSRAVDVTFSSGSTATAGFPRYGSYAYQPLAETRDTVVGRKTRIVGCSSPDNIYAGNWTVKDDPVYFQKRIRECSTPGSSIQFSFRGGGIYWRAVADSDGGKADVYVDNALQSTVDCYYRESLPFQFAFIKTGLDPTRRHVIRIVVRAGRNERSKGTMIRHMAFEHSAESYSAAAGFTNVMGKNCWWYQSDDGHKRENLEFLYAYKSDVRAGNERGLFPNCWGGTETCLIGDNYCVAAALDAVRTFVAPHAGTIRIEGVAEIGSEENASRDVRILKNDKDVLSEATVKSAGPFRHDFSISVKKGDAISFVVRKNPGKKGEKVIWDPAITFLN